MLLNATPITVLWHKPSSAQWRAGCSGDVFQRFPGLTVASADTVVMERMSDLRVHYGIPTPDAIHLGTALAHGAGAFVTNDARLQRVTEMDVLLLSEFV